MRRDRGFALAAALMVLALLSVLGAAAIQSTTLEVKISAHDRDARAALYLAEAALEEARYQIARSWGGTERHAPNQVRVTAPAPAPAGFWDDQRYVGFTFVGDDGASFSITDHTPGPNPVVTVDAGDPAVGLFTVSKGFGAA
ncbi:MAG: PilX N-terminal domain-containing pilus assembly protein, partial [Deferrisomatales bacterium]